MADVVTEVKEVGWFQRLREAIGGILVGTLMFLGAFPLLFWNEGRAVQTAKSLEEGMTSVKTVPADKVDPAFDSKLVHLIAQATTQDVLSDSTFGVSLVALRLRRSVEMYQWDEDEETKTEKKLGGGETRTTTYKYSKEWSSRAIDSSGFKERSGHENPPMKFTSEDWAAQTVMAGAFRLSQNLVGQIDNYQDLLASEFGGKLPGDLGPQLRIEGNGYYLGGSSSSPQVGDHRIKFSVVRPTQVSVVARQAGPELAGYQTQAGDVLEMLEVGNKSSQEMFQSAMTANTVMTWVLRLVGFFLMFIGVSMVLNPLKVFADVIPFIGSMVGVGVALAALAVAAPMSLMTIGVAWLVYRPLWGVLLVGAGIGIFVWLRGMGKKASAAPTTISAPPPLPQ